MTNNCPVRELLSYMYKNAKLRDAQIEAIKTYLFLKIACQCRSLYDLFTDGEFNSNINWDELELTSATRDFLRNNPAAAALYEYASMFDDNGKPFSPKLSGVSGYEAQAAYFLKMIDGKNGGDKIITAKDARDAVALAIAERNGAEKGFNSKKRVEKK